MKRFFTMLFIIVFTLPCVHAQQNTIKTKTSKNNHRIRKLQKQECLEHIEEKGGRLAKKPEKKSLKRKVETKRKRENLIKKQKRQHYEKLKEQPLKAHSKVTETDSCSVDDSLALVAIYNKMNGENWTNQDNWLTNSPVKDWWGITVENYRVTKINLYHDSIQNVSGNFANELWELTELKYLKLSYNNISDSIPSDIDSLRKLEYLILNDNQLTGSIPQELGNLSNLQNLNLHRNQLTDSIPAELGDLSNLQSLGLGSNELTGSIPSELGNLSNLQMLNLNYNQLQGSIPQELGNLTNLIEIGLYNNELTGSIPPNLGELANLEYFDVKNNQLEDTIPSKLGNLTNLQWLVLGNNQLKELPDLSSLKKLEGCYVQSNTFTFEDFETAGINWDSIPNKAYAPQDTLLELDTVSSGGQYTLTVNTGATNNKYIWRKNGNTFDTTSTNSITVNDSLASYKCKIINDSFPDLTLESKSVSTGNLNHGVYEKDYDALVALYDSTNGANWDNNDLWLSDTHVNNWNGVTVENNRVTEINLSNNNLSGTIPDAIGKLTKLRSLTLSKNQIYGSIPDTIGSMDNISWIDLSWNQLEDNIPPKIGKMENLKYLWLHQNQLTGTIPSQLGNLSNLEYIQLGNNTLTGSLPPELGNLSQMKSFTIWGNQLEGAVPDEFTNLTNLNTLNLNDNQLDSLPDLSALSNLNKMQVQLNNLSFKDLKTANLDWSDTLYNYAPQKTFPDPDTIHSGDKIIMSVRTESSNSQSHWYRNDSLIQSTDIDSITIASEEPASYYCKISNPEFPELTLETKALFTGNLVNGVAEKDYEALVALYDSTNGDNWDTNTNWKTDTLVKDWHGVKVENHRVKYLSLYNNNLSGTIPDAFYNLTQLQVIGFSDNQIKGTLSPKIDNLEKLSVLGLPGNSLTGGIPSEIYKLNNLKQISLERNELEDEIPDKIGNLGNLEYINLGGNKISGNIPREMGNLQKLEVLYLANNKLNGNIPAELKYLENLRLFVLWGNQLTDTIPSGLENLDQLKTLNLAHNELEGSIPKKWGNFNQLTELNVGNNKLEDSIPHTLGNIGGLKKLILDGNNLKGSIPQSLGNLDMLKELGLYSNKLTGSLPSELGNLDSLRKLNIARNELSGDIPPTFNNLSKCSEFILSWNQLDSLPNLENMNLNIFNAHNNNLDFKDLKRTGYVSADIPDFMFTPQKNIPLVKDTTNNDSVKLAVTNMAANCNYKWYKDGQPRTQETDSTLIYAVKDTSTYYSKITHPDYPNQELHSEATGKNIIQGVAEKDLKALKAIYEKTEGDQWNRNDNWMSEKDVNLWHGITVGGYRVRKLHLADNNLKGNFPTETFQLDSLEYIGYWDNHLKGEIPDQFDQLPQLTQLGLMSNQFEGAIPATLNSVKGIEQIYLYNNNLKLSCNLGKLTNLERLYLNKNCFTFTDLDTIKIEPGSISKYGYASQSKFILEQDTLYINQGGSLSLNIDSLSVKKLGGSSYQWFKDGSIISNTPELTISSISKSDTGEYTCRLNNPDYPELTLTSQPLRVNFNKAPENISLNDSTVTENNPTNTTIGLLSAIDKNEGDHHYFKLVAGDGNNDADNDKFTIQGDTLKADRSFNFENQSIRNVYIRAIDKAGKSTEKEFQIDVLDRNDSPTFTSDPYLYAKEDSLYKYEINTNDEDGDSLVFATNGLPDWLNLKGTGNGTATLSGTPKDEDVGTDTVCLKITDNIIDQPVKQEFTIEVENVNTAPQYTSNPIEQAKETSGKYTKKFSSQDFQKTNTKADYSYNYQIKAIDADKDALSYSVDTIPDWLTMQDNGNGTAELFGNPLSEHVGDHQVTINVSDGKDTVDQSFTITVLEADVNALPEFKNLPDTLAHEDSLYLYKLEGNDLENDSIIFKAQTTLPDWLKLKVKDKNKALLIGQPDNGDVGTETIIITATDEHHSDSSAQHFNLNVKNSNDPPKFTSEPVSHVKEDSSYRYHIKTEDIDDQQLSLITKAKPEWLKMEYSNGENYLTGTPENKNVGTYMVNLELTDNHIKEPVKQNFNLEVENTNDRPVITSETPKEEVSEDSTFTYIIKAKDLDNDSLSFNGKGIPDWLELKARDSVSAILKGTPRNRNVGDHQITINVDDGHLKQPVQKNFPIKVINTNDKPEFISEPKKEARLNKSYSYELKAIDKDGDSIHYDFTTLPEWLNLTENQDSTAVLSGTPTNTGNVIIGITITDSIISKPVKQLYTLKIKEQNRTPSFTSTPVKRVKEGQNYEYSIEANDENDDPLKFTAIELPNWLTLTDNGDGTAILSGEPKNEDVGSHQITLSIRDNHQSSTEQTFSLKVINVNDKPYFTSEPVSSVKEDSTYQHTVEAEDIDGDPITITAPELPGWISFSDNGNGTASLSGTPSNDNVGSDQVVLNLDDGNINSPVEQSFSIEVINVNDKPYFTSEPVTSVKEDSKYKYSISAYDIDGDALSFKAEQKPSWLNLEATGDSSAKLYGIPKSEQIGDHNVSLTITDGSIDTPIQQDFTITVEGATAISQPDLTKQITIHPNPTSGKIIVEGVKKGAQFIVTDISGTSILKQKIRKIPARLDLSNSTKGIYLLKYIEGDQSAIFRIIVE